MEQVLVKWTDSSMCDGWCEIAEKIEISDCITKGFLIREDDKEIEICHTVSATGNKAGCITIPRHAIIRMKREPYYDDWFADSC